jgi:uncharacterized damage-inducible protein DinB
MVFRILLLSRQRVRTTATNAHRHRNSNCGTLMKRCILTFIALLTLAPTAQAQQPADGEVLSTYLRRSYAAVSKDLVAVVEMMPEQDFGFRPAGAVKEVRTFGEIVAHVVLVNSWVCSMAEGRPDSTSSMGSAIAVDKARLVALLNETNTRCTTYLATLTDTALTRVVTTGTAPRELQAVRGNALIFAIVHSNEHYGNLVTYLRAKGLVPPTTPSQASFLSPVPKS